MMRPAGVKTFDEYAQHISILYIFSEPQSMSCVGLIKSEARRGCKEMCGLEGGWNQETGWTRQNYSVSCPRCSFSHYGRQESSCPLMGRGALHTVTAGSPQPGPMQPWRNWYHMLLLVSHASQHGNYQMFICTVDTDAVVLTECELWLAFRAGFQDQVWHFVLFEWVRTPLQDGSSRDASHKPKCINCRLHGCNAIWSDKMMLLKLQIIDYR